MQHGDSPDGSPDPFHLPAGIQLPIKQKVAIYLFDKDLKSVLTFTQAESPEAGRQVPAGTVEDVDESLLHTATRELAEETGVMADTRLFHFGNSIYDMSKYKNEIHLRVWFFGIDLNESFPQSSWTFVEQRPHAPEVTGIFEWTPLETVSSQLIAGHSHLLGLALDLARQWMPEISREHSPHVAK